MNTHIICFCREISKITDTAQVLVKALFFNPKVLIVLLFLHENIC